MNLCYIRGTSPAAALHCSRQRILICGSHSSILTLLKSRSTLLFINLCFTTLSVLPPPLTRSCSLSTVDSLDVFDQTIYFCGFDRGLAKTRFLWNILIFTQSKWKWANFSLKCQNCSTYSYNLLNVNCILLTFAMSSAPPRLRVDRWDDGLIRDSGPISKRGRLISAYSTSDWLLSSGM